MLQSGLSMPPLSSQQREFSFPHELVRPKLEPPTEKSIRRDTSSHGPSMGGDPYADPTEFSSGSSDKLGHLVKTILSGQNMANMLNGGSPFSSPLMNGLTGEELDPMHPLFGNSGDGHGTCKWPGCEMAFDDFQSFLR